MSRNGAENGLSPLLLETYKQAHETRRRWENHIWQWGVLLTVLAALFVRFSDTSPEIGIVQKLVLTLVTAFVAAISLNVMRARVLMKALDHAIARFHESHIEQAERIPIVPAELDSRIPAFARISSTYVAVMCHFAAVVVFVCLTVYAWIWQ